MSIPGGSIGRNERARRRNPLCGHVLVTGFLVLMAAADVRGQLSADSPEEGISSKLTARLSAQVAAWNEGDIEKFMEFYWKSERLSFSSGGRTVRGWKATRDGYYRRYADRDAMGRLAFERIEVIPLGENAALVLGHWQLDRTVGPLRGNFSLVFRRINDQWLIIHDHTSILPSESDSSEG